MIQNVTTLMKRALMPMAGMVHSKIVLKKDGSEKVEEHPTLSLLHCPVCSSHHQRPELTHLRRASPS